MQLTSRFRIKKIQSLIEFLNERHVGRLATIDSNGFPQVIPMNFVHIVDLKDSSLSLDFNRKEIEKKELEDFLFKKTGGSSNDKQDTIGNNIPFTKNKKHCIYMHSHHTGEKIENIRRNPKVGFEADKEICFLPSYYFHPTDASFADTLYISIVIKGYASIVTDNQEKSMAMNEMMKKYQKEGRYEELSKDMKSIEHLTVIRIDVETIDGKYKIGQQWPVSYKKDIAKKIIEREGIAKAEDILRDMNISILSNGEIEATDQVTM